MVKSLHPEIFAGILANKEERLDKEIKAFDFVVVDLYPFEQYIDKNVELETLIKNIDIGGVALLRAGAKNYENVCLKWMSFMIHKMYFTMLFLKKTTDWITGPFIPIEKILLFIVI